MKTKQRTLTVLLAMVLVLGGLLWLITRSNAAEEAASSAAAEGSIVLSSFAAGDAEQIRYTYQNETITLNCDSGSWTLADDPDYHLDASACNTMVTALASLNAKRQLAAQPGEDYGLADPAVTVTVTAAGETNTFAFGSQNPVTGDLYVQKTEMMPFTPSPATRQPALNGLKRISLARSTRQDSQLLCWRASPSQQMQEHSR